MSPFPFFPPNLAINPPLLQSHGLFFFTICYFMHAPYVCIYTCIYVCITYIYAYMCIYNAKYINYIFLNIIFQSV